MKHIIFFKLIFASILISITALAAPMPGTSSSALVSPQLGIFRSPLGFEINAAGSGWAHVEPPRESKSIITMYRAPNSGTATPKEAASLTVRVDRLEKEMVLEKYVQKWLKEYPKYGFDILGSKAFVQNKISGYVLDVVNRETQKQLRQVVYVKEQKAIILTCRDHIQSFEQSLKNCNQIVKSFQWTQ